MTLKKTTALIGVTMGDPAGIGPEVLLRYVHENREQAKSICIIGSESILKTQSTHFNFNLPFNTLDDNFNLKSGHINIYDPQPTVVKSEFAISKKEFGHLSFQYIDKAIELALSHKIDAVVTCPISKESLKKAGYSYPGHTEIFAEKTDSSQYSMMFTVENLSVLHVTTHCSLLEAIEKITTHRVLETITLLNTSLQSMGIKKPRIAVSGLNPHAGESGMFGTEDLEYITPAIEMAQQQGISCDGPHPPDTVFMRGFRGDFDGIVSMLHDHGFTALKSRNFAEGVNMTVGLPIIRTSVGHGTAYDVAGKGIATTTSLQKAIETAAKMIEFKNRG